MIQLRGEKEGDCRLNQKCPQSLPPLVFLLVLLVLSAAPVFGGEVIYLQGGEEYRGTAEKIADGQLHAQIGAKHRTFPLDQIQRVEFQRRRLLDDVRTAAGLPDRLPFFRRALEPSTQELRRRFPQASYIVLADETVATLGRRGAYEIKRFQAWRILQQRGARLARRSLSYFPDRQEVEVLFGLTVGPDGTVARVADTAMKDEALYSRLPAYNYQHRLRFNLKNAVPGATFFLATALRGRASVLEPLVLDRVFWGTEPAVERSVRLAAPRELEGQVAVVATNGLKAVSKWFWRVTDAPQVFHEPMMPPFEAFSPRLVIAWPKGAWRDIARAFRRCVGGSARLRGHGDSPREVFDHVRTRIRIEDVPLDALPDGPARPWRVLSRRYGNEVERALLLAALLRGAGGQAETILIRAREDGPLLAEAPRLRGFNHAVVRTTGADGQGVWLHPDDDNRGFGELAPGVQGAEGLNIETGELVTVPVRPSMAEALRRSVDVELAPDGSGRVRDSYALLGHYAAGYRQLKKLTDDELRKWAARFVGSEVTGVDLLGFEHSDFQRANDEERLTFTYRVPALAEKAGKFLILRLPNASVSAAAVGRSTRERDLFWEGPEREEASFVVRAPAGYRVYALGDHVVQQGEGWLLAAGFEAGGSARGVVEFREVWDRSALAAPQAAYAAYRGARMERSRLRRQVIVFVKER